jgi:adenylylsulfate kinase-like enzyme
MTRNVVQDCESARGDSGQKSWRFRSGEIAVAVVVLVGLTTAGVLAATALRAMAAHVSSLNTDLVRMKQGRDLEWQLQEDRRRFLAILAAGTSTTGNENGAMQYPTPAPGVTSPEIAAYRVVEQEAIGLILAHRMADAEACEMQRGRKLFDRALRSAHAALKAADEDSARRWDAIDGCLRDMALAGGIFLLVALTGTAALVLRERLRTRTLRSLSKRNRELRSASGWERERNRVLELIGNNQSLEVICDAIVGIVESRHNHVCCGIAVVRQGKLGLVSARRLSTTMVRVLNSSGGEGGSAPSQLAFHSGKPVFVESIATDPL